MQHIEMWQRAGPHMKRSSQPRLGRLQLKSVLSHVHTIRKYEVADEGEDVRIRKSKVVTD